jgi:hypothetical protein
VNCCRELEKSRMSKLRKITGDVTCEKLRGVGTLWGIERSPKCCVFVLLQGELILELTPERAGKLPPYKPFMGSRLVASLDKHITKPPPIYPSSQLQLKDIEHYESDSVHVALGFPAPSHEHFAAWYRDKGAGSDIGKAGRMFKEKKQSVTKRDDSDSELCEGR